MDKYVETEKEVKWLEERFDKTGKFKPIESPARKVWTDKDGKKITYAEFMERWKTGMKGITQSQQTKMQLNSTYIMLIGIACGFVISLFNWSNLWWLAIILGAAFFNTGVGALGLWQKKIAYAEMEKMIEEAEE
jgi:hypothetical protein|tara:strand:+ start:328 stop:729 length:402 start_codon:yes stop_codon:yes gene_type:complete